MKKVVLFGLAVFLLAASVAVAGDGKLPEGQAMVALNVTGMSCGSCCTKVETAVAKLDGVVDVKADYAKGVATITYETDKVELAQIVETINTETSFKAEAPKSKTS